MRVIVVVALLVALAMTGCKGNGKTYSTADVERAFHSQGLDLTGPTYPNRPSSGGKGPAFWWPRGRDPFKPFMVVRFDQRVNSDAAATELQASSSVPARHVGRANVVVILSSSVPAPVEKRIRAAIDGLD